MPFNASNDDLDFAHQFESGGIDADQFSHRAHLRLAYVYLTEAPVDEASARMKAALLAFLDRNGVPTEKYHETLTVSWVSAVRHFMDRGQGATSFAEFISRNGVLLDTDVMLTHYARETLFSDVARARFIPPDLEPIPNARNGA